MRGGARRRASLEAPFVGRDEELRLVKDLFHATIRERKPRLVTVIGQAGIGKSRLGWEFEKYIDGVALDAYWHAGRSPSYGEGISFWALAEMVRERAGIAETDAPDAARAKLAACLAEWLTDAEERRWVEPRLAGLLGLEEMPAGQREELFAAWRTFFERIADRDPVILVFKDLHWADAGLLEFIEHLLGWAKSHPIYVLAMTRPDLLERHPNWGSAVRNATTIALEPLGDEPMTELLRGLVPGLPADAVAAIVARAEGVPLYAVETVRMLIDRGQLTAEGEGYALAGPLTDLEVPETLHALVAARIDANEPEDRALLADGAVLGQSFTPAALAGMTERSEESLQPSLERLVRRELLIRDDDPRSPERGQYRFVQAVVREVSYDTLSKADRRAKHLAAARYYEGIGDEELAGRSCHPLPRGAARHARRTGGRSTGRPGTDRSPGRRGPGRCPQRVERCRPSPVRRARDHHRRRRADLVVAWAGPRRYAADRPLRPRPRAGGGCSGRPDRRPRQRQPGAGPGSAVLQPHRPVEPGAGRGRAGDRRPLGGRAGRGGCVRRGGAGLHAGRSVGRLGDIRRACAPRRRAAA